MLVFVRFACDDGSRRVLARLEGSRQAKNADIAQRRVGVGELFVGYGYCGIFIVSDYIKSAIF